MKDDQFLIDQIKMVIQPATGCTEPVAIALNCSTARKHCPGNIKKVTVHMDLGLFKNAMGVGIPGFSKRGIKYCVALGLLGGDADAGMNVLHNIDDSYADAAEEMLPLIEASVQEGMPTLFVETILETDEDTVRVITYDHHDNIISIDRPPFAPFQPPQEAEAKDIQNYTLEEMKDFADHVSLDKLSFLKDGIQMNMAIAEKGMQLRFGQSLAAFRDNPQMENSLMAYVQMVTGSASYARMSGVPLPVMTATGSGNQGITLFLTVYSAGEKMGASEEKILRALAMAHLVNLYAKSYIGTLSPLCSCSIASGLGASVGIVYLLDGTTHQMLGAIKNTLGGIAGMICDGAKEGCANKVALSATSAVLSAQLAVAGTEISSNDGILGTSLKDLFQHMSYLANNGMAETNEAIVHIMTTKE